MSAQQSQNNPLGTKSILSSPWGAFYVIRKRRGADGKTFKKEAINLTSYAISAQIRLIEDGASSWNAAFINPQNKLLGVVRQFDRVIIMGGRHKEEGFQILTGYVDKAPWDLDFPGDPIQLSGYCTLYRAALRYWDPFLPQFKNFAQTTPDVLLRYLAIDPALGGFQPQDVFIEPLAQGVRERWEVAQTLSAPTGSSVGSNPNTGSLGSNPARNEIISYMSQKFEAVDIPAKYAVASSLIETGGTLNADTRQGTFTGAGIGLFQTFSGGAGGGQPHVGEIRDAERNPHDKITKYYPAAHQIEDAAGWWKGSHPPRRSATDSQWASWVSNSAQKPAARQDYINKMLQRLPEAVRLLSNAAAISSQPSAFNTTTQVGQDIAGAPARQAAAANSLDMSAGGGSAGSGRSSAQTANQDNAQSNDQNTTSQSEDLEQTVLNDNRIQFSNQSEKDDIKNHAIDARVLALLLVLANNLQRGKKLIVTALKSDHGTMTSSGNVSEHSIGQAVDIGSFNNVVLNPQSSGGAPGTQAKNVASIAASMGSEMTAHQIIADFPGTLDTSVPGQFFKRDDHNNHVHIGYGGTHRYSNNSHSVQEVMKDTNNAQGGGIALGNFGDSSQNLPAQDAYVLNPWEQADYKVKYENLDDVPVLNWVNKVASWGWYKVTTNGKGQMIAQVPKYLGKPNYKISEMEIIAYMPQQWSLRDLYTHIYVTYSLTAWYQTSSVEAQQAFTFYLGASTIYDKINRELILNEPFFAPWRKKLKDAFAASDKLTLSPDQGTVANPIEFISPDDPAVKAIEKMLGESCGERPQPIIQENELRTFAQAQLSADFHFREAWFNRYQCALQCTFLPSLRPQYVVHIAYKQMDYYATEVVHTMFDSWSTSVSLIAGRPHSTAKDEPDKKPTGEA